MELPEIGNGPKLNNRFKGFTLASGCLNSMEMFLLG